jgi:TetR/AcrR family transcriptional regulator
MVNDSIVEYTEQEEKIFHAALKVFAKHGKSGARIQDIADLAGINKALVHYYFRSKERLYDSVFTFVITKYFRLISESMSRASDFETMLKEFISTYIETISSNPELPQFLFGEIIRDSEAVYERIANRIQHIPANPLQAFESSMKKAIESGQIRDTSPAHTFLSIIGASVVLMIAQPIARVALPTIDYDYDEILSQRKHHVFDIIYNGLRQ